MVEMDFHHAFDADFVAGRLFWKNPPKNHAEKLGREAGYIVVGKGKNKSYWHIRVFGRTFKRSRIMFYLKNGRWPEPMADHHNGNSLDDRPENLREANASQNTASACDRLRVYDLPRGVYETKQGRFMARMTSGGHTRSLGTFDTPEQAQSIFLSAKMEAFGEFA